MPRDGDKKGCKECNKTSKSQARRDGFCKKHQEHCKIHKYWYHYTGESCKQCDDEAERQAKAAQQLKDKQCKDEEKEEEEEKKEEGEWGVKGEKKGERRK